MKDKKTSFQQQVFRPTTTTWRKLQEMNSEVANTSWQWCKKMMKNSPMTYWKMEYDSKWGWDLEKEKIAPGKHSSLKTQEEIKQEQKK